MDAYHNATAPYNQSGGCVTARQAERLSVLETDLLVTIDKSEVHPLESMRSLIGLLALPLLAPPPAP